MPHGVLPADGFEWPYTTLAEPEGDPYDTSASSPTWPGWPGHRMAFGSALLEWLPRVPVKWPGIRWQLVHLGISLHAQASARS
jgi:hypothetical protein